MLAYYTQISTTKAIYLVTIIALVFSSLNGLSQIKAPTADRVDSTEYSDELIHGKDPIYVFYTPNFKGHDVGGDLTASLNDTLLLTYKWYTFNTISNNFDILRFSEDSVTKSTYTQTIYKKGGYRVRMLNTELGIDTSWYAWIHLNQFELGFPSIKSSTCTRMELATSLSFEKEFEYRDLSNIDSVLYKYNEIDSLYWTTKGGYSYPLPATLNPGFPAPTTPTKFTITVKDIYGYTVEKYLDLTREEPLVNGYTQLIAVEADFKASRYFVDKNNIPKGEGDTIGQAPMNIQFANDSKNAERYHWTFYNDYLRIGMGYDSVKFETNEIRPIDSILYDYPGKYAVKLTVSGPLYNTAAGEKRCSDPLLKEDYITVDTVSMPKFMNVFTPDGDTKNDRFYFENYPGENSGGDYVGPRSIKEFSIKIYSRWGGKMYDYNGKIEDWNGWDGETPGIGIAKTGVYFYHAIYIGYNNITYQERKGFIHLYRD